MDDIRVEKIKYPFRDDIHRLKHERAGVNSWRDIYGIKYRYVAGEDTLIITSPDDNQLIPDTIIEHVNALPDGVKVIFNLGGTFNITGLNLLLESFSHKKSNKNIVIDVTNMHIRIKDNISLWDLPKNVKISNTCAMSKSHYFGENDFDWWLLRRSETDFYRVIGKLDKDSFNRAAELESIVFDFYAKYGDSFEKMDDKVKCFNVFRWIKNNTEFAGSRTVNGTEWPISIEHSDPIATYQTGKGVCTGRARLFKSLLSNRYFNINCYLVSGMHGKTGHEWNEVYFEDGTRLYYDINFGLNGKSFLNESYSEIEHSDRERNGGNEESNYVRPLPVRGDRTSVSVVPLPPRRDKNSDGVPVRNKEKRKVIPPLPPRNKEKRKTVPSLPKRRDNQEG